MEYIKKTLTIKEKQDKWIKDNHINFSRLVQDLLDKEIRKSRKR